MKRQKRLTRNQRRNQAYLEAQADAMEKALAIDPVAFDFETLGPVSGRMGSTTPNLQYLPRNEDFYNYLRDLLVEHKHVMLGLPPPQRMGGPGTLFIVDDPLAHTDYAELERRVLERAFAEATPNKALTLSSFGEELPDHLEQAFEKMVEDDIRADTARAAEKVVSFAAAYGSTFCSTPFRCVGGKINGIGPARGLGRVRRP